MSSTTSRSLLRVSPLATAGPAIATGPAAAASSAQSRRTFLQASAGAAAGVAVVTSGPKLAAAALGGHSTSPALIVKPSGPPPSETVMAYVRDGARGEVTVLSGTRETTYRDPELAKRLIDAGR